MQLNQDQKNIAMHNKPNSLIKVFGVKPFTMLNIYSSCFCFCIKETGGGRGAPISSNTTWITAKSAGGKDTRDLQHVLKSTNDPGTKSRAVEVFLSSATMYIIIPRLVGAGWGTNGRAWGHGYSMGMDGSSERVQRPGPSETSSVQGVGLLK
jgi:hypothetical protein